MSGVERFGNGLIGFLRRVSYETRGAVAVYLALGTSFLFPLVAISIDLTKYYTLHTELELAAQAAALSAAKELDFTDAGLAAAIIAARQTVQNFQTGATDAAEKGEDIEIETIQFLRALPPAGEENFEDYITTQAKEARYVRTITEIRSRESFTMNAYRSIWNASANATAGTKSTIAGAIAGRTAIACRTLPLMTCNPVEGDNEITNDGTENDYPNVFDDPGTAPGFDFLSDFLKRYPQWTRNQLRIKFIGPDTGYANGVFGLLEPHFTENHGARGIEDELALGTPTSCIILDEVQAGDVDVKTGQAQTIVDGINVRLDVFQGNWNSERNNPDYPTGPINIKGMMPKDLADPNYCKMVPADDTYNAQKLPQDNCFIATDADELLAFSPRCYAIGTQDGDIITPGNNKGFAGRYGNGQYDMLKYFQVNHPNELGPDIFLADGTPGQDGLGDSILPGTFLAIETIEKNYLAANGMPPPPVTTAPTTGNLGVPPSRHSIYLWEYENSKTPGPFGDAHGHTTANATTPQEEGVRMCSNVDSVGPIRRSLFVAIVNCIEHEEALNSGDRIVPVQEFAEVFLTELADHNGAGGGSGDKGAIYIELKRAMKPGDAENVVLRDLIQLY